MNPIAIQISLLPGASLDDQFAVAKAVGADGIELVADDATYAALPEFMDSLERHGLRTSALRLGHTRLLHPDYGERERAMVAIQDALTAAADLGASGVVFYAHYAPHHVLPDLEPYKAAVELEAELLITLLRKTLCDLANALNVRLLLAHADSATTALLRRPEHAALIRQRLDNHPMLYVAARLAHIDADGIDASAALAMPGIGSLTICDTGGRLPGHGARDWNALAAALHVSGFDGWITVEAAAPASADELAQAIATLRAAGI